MDLLNQKKYKKRRYRRYRKYKQHRYVLGDRELMVQGYEPQALDYLLGRGFEADQIICEVEGGVPEIFYKYGKRKKRKYVPDMFIPDLNLIIEVKSISTLGLKYNKRRGWSMTCAKAIACHKQGYRFALLLMSADGQRLKMPKNWAKMKKEDVRQAVEEFGGFVSKKPLML